MSNDDYTFTESLKSENSCSDNFFSSPIYYYWNNLNLIYFITSSSIRTSI